MNSISNINSTEQNKIINSDASINQISLNISDRNDESSQKNENEKTNSKNYEIIKNTFLAYEPDEMNKLNFKNSFLEIAIFTNEISEQDSKLSYHLFKNQLNEVYIFKFDKEKENTQNKEENSVDDEKKEDNIYIQNIYTFKCYDDNCSSKGTLAINLTNSINNNYNYIFNISKEHSIPYQEHSYYKNLEGSVKIYMDIIIKNPQIKNIQLINVPNDFNEKSCIPLEKDNKLNLNSLNSAANKLYEYDSEYQEGQEGNNDLNDNSYKKNKKFKNDKMLYLNIKRQRKPYNVIKQKEYTFVNSKLETLVYAEEKYFRGKDARLENSTSRQNWFSYIHQKFGSRTRLGPHFHRSKKDNKIYKYVIKHLLTGFEDKTLSFYCPLSSCSGKGIMNLENEIFIEVKKHDMSYENHFFRGHQIIDDYYKAHPEITDIQVLRTQSRKDAKEN